MSETVSSNPPRTKRLFADFIAAGTASDDFALRAFNIEIRAYERLCGYARTATLKDVTDEGLVLERGEFLRQKLQSLEPDMIPLQTRLL
ncbi:hypothetical protein BDW59DRAFT_165130 [Aspergillus cavernicola]|uniref:Uncharacterized protein n=1 Tax=Aspergillus cavernicola TaxID=176166 RepID=A0ABR4HX20_9EURO